MRALRSAEARVLAWAALLAAVALLYALVLGPLFVAPLWRYSHRQHQLAEREQRVVAVIARGNTVTHRRAALAAQSGAQDLDLPGAERGAASAALVQQVQGVLLQSTRQGAGCVGASETPLTTPDLSGDDLSSAGSALGAVRSVRVSVVIACGTTALTGVLERLAHGHPLLIVEGLDAYRAASVASPGNTVVRPLQVQLIVRGFWRPGGGPP